MITLELLFQRLCSKRMKHMNLKWHIFAKGQHIIPSVLQEVKKKVGFIKKIFSHSK